MPDVEPFEEFYARLAAAEPHEYADALRAGMERAGITQGAEAEFERAKAYLLIYYQGVHPVCSYLDAAGQPVDCVPREQQPAARTAVAAGHRLEPPPRPAGVAGARAAPGKPPQAPAVRAVCPPGSVPLPRRTLEWMLRFGAFERAFQKDTVVLPPDTKAPADPQPGWPGASCQSGRGDTGEGRS